MQEHRRADADGEAGDRRHDRLLRAPERRDEAESGKLVALTRRGAGKVCDIVPGCERVALGAEQDDANGRVVVGALQGFGHGPVHRVR
jgi:hypothetical protein